MVELKKKVTLRTKIPDANTENPVNPTPDGGGSHGGAGKWVAIIVGIILIAAVIYYFTRKDGGESAPEQPETTLVADSTQSAPADSAAGDASGENVEAAAHGGADDAQQPAEAGTETAVVEVQSGPQQAAVTGGDADSLAREVIRGKYGNGAVRKQRLGDRYAEVQAKVNEMYRNGLVN